MNSHGSGWAGYLSVEATDKQQRYNQNRFFHNQSVVKLPVGCIAAQFTLNG